MLFFVSYFPPAYTRINGEKQSVRLPHAPHPLPTIPHHSAHFLPSPKMFLREN